MTYQETQYGAGACARHVLSNLHVLDGPTATLASFRGLTSLSAFVLNLRHLVRSRVGMIVVSRGICRALAELITELKTAPPDDYDQTLCSDNKTELLNL